MFACLLAQEDKLLLSHIHGEDHKQTQNQHKEESNHAGRIARRLNFVLYREFANEKQFCKPLSVLYPCQKTPRRLCCPPQAAKTRSLEITV